MAWVEPTVTGIYHICFRFGNERFKRSARTKNRRKAEAMMLRLEENTSLVERGRLLVPSDADLFEFLISDGQVTGSKAKPQPKLRLAELYDRYEESLPRDAIAPESLRVMAIHMRHAVRIIGGRRKLGSISTADLQRYISSRAAEKGYRAKPVSTGTIRKELSTFRTLWRWAKRFGFVEKDFPNVSVT